MWFLNSTIIRVNSPLPINPGSCQMIIQSNPNAIGMAIKAYLTNVKIIGRMIKEFVAPTNCILLIVCRLANIPNLTAL